jgi:hypothetical protein
METSLADMKAGFPSAPEPIQGIPNLQSLIKLLFHFCCCAQMHHLPASEAMNLLFCAYPRNVHGFFTADPYPTNFSPFPTVVDKVPDYTGCVDENECASKHAKHALDKKTRADIITMNAALTDVFLDALSLQVRASWLIVMHVCVAGPMGRTQHIISLYQPMGYIYVWHWKGCFHLCLTVILALSVYVWRDRLIVASMLDALARAHTVRLCLRPYCQHLLFIVAVVALLLSPLCNKICCKMKLVCLRMRGLLTTYVVVAAVLLLLSPSHNAIWKYRALVHEALSFVKALCDVIWNAQGLVVVAVVQHDVKMACACAQGLDVVAIVQRNVKRHWLLLNCHCIIVDCCLSNDDSQYKSLCACAWGAHHWHMLLLKPCLLLLPLHHTICK